MGKGQISKTQRQAAKLTERITQITSSKSPVLSTYEINDDSVQAELRLSAEWTIAMPIDKINYPRDLNLEHPNQTLWQHISDLTYEIDKTTTFIDRRMPEDGDHIIKINTRLKNGEAKRAEAKTAWEIEVGKQFLADYQRVTKKSNLKKMRQQIAALQAQQKTLISQLRASNSTYLAARKIQSAEQTRKNAEAMKTGRFWEADRETLKNYFHPPFARNYLADVSGKWRAALYTEIDSTAWKARNGWRHKNIGTGHAYLCGIDDNGDEWGHRVEISKYLDQDYYGDMGYAGVSVEDAMEVMYSHRPTPDCYRQGDLLFCPADIPTDIEIHSHAGPWQIRESHEILSTNLKHNGKYFASENPIYVRHTSHAMQTLPPGGYRLYMLQTADAD